MKKNITYKLIETHLLEGEMKPGEEIGIKIDQTLTQDATGTMVMQELEAMALDRVKTEVSAQYVDHNLLQEDYKNADDHIFLQSACQRFGLLYSKPGNGVSHPVHMEYLGKPGKSLLGSDSHTPAAGALSMLAIGAGGIEVALAMAGKPYHFKMPKVMGVHLTGSLPDWVSAKDVILEMLRRHSVKGGVGWIIEYFGPGLQGLNAMDRHVIANMGAELGATTSVFPSDRVVKTFLEQQGRGQDWVELLADEHASYDEYEEINLSNLEPLIACPSSPDNVSTVREVKGKEIYQSMIGSSANPGYRDFAIAGLIVKDKIIHPRVSLDINPTSRQILEDLTESGILSMLIKAGARIHQAGCNGCIGMGQAPATNKNSLRTVPRNFPGRSGTKDDLVYLCSPETAAASALKGVITDPRELGVPYPKVTLPEKANLKIDEIFVAPSEAGERQELIKGPNIKPLPIFPDLANKIEGPVLIKVGNNISTDEISPAGARVLPFRSNVQKLSQFIFEPIDPSYYERTKPYREKGHFIVAGLNYGQGSSREHAALAPRYLGVQAVIAKSFARIHWQNLVNFGILPLSFADKNDYDKIAQGDVLEILDVRKKIKGREQIEVVNKTKNEKYMTTHAMSLRQIQILLEGGCINHFRKTNI